MMIKFKEEPFHLNCHKTFLVSLLLSEQNTFDCEGKTKQYNLILLAWAQQIIINLIVSLFYSPAFFFFPKQHETSKCYKICEQWHWVKCHTINISYSIEIHSNKPSACLPVEAEGGWKILSSELGLEASSNFRSFKERAVFCILYFVIRLLCELTVPSELQYKQNTKDLENTLQSRNFN